MILFQPIKRVRHEEVGYFSAPIVVDVGVPVLMEAFAWVGMLIKCCSVEPSKTMRVGREVTWDPVEDDPKPFLVRRIDQVAKLVGWAEPDRGRIHANGLITPGPVKRILTDRQQFEMGEPHIDRVIDQFFGKLLVGQGPIAVLGLTTPASQMHFVNRDGRGPRVFSCTL